MFTLRKFAEVISRYTIASARLLKLRRRKRPEIIMFSVWTKKRFFIKKLHIIFKGHKFSSSRQAAQLSFKKFRQA